MERETNKHESFGNISFSRIQCNPPQKFYGSQLDQSHYIQMTLSESKVDKDLSKEWFHATGKILAKVRMSSGQFAELITSLNQGTGVPCTVEVIVPVQESRKEFVHKKFKARMVDFAKKIHEKQNKATEIVKKKTLSKDDVTELTHHIEWLSTEIASNIPFFAECFQETMDAVVFEAKTEVENAIQHKISVLGLNELHKQNNLLKEKNDE